jgi:hypothetical protein
VELESPELEILLRHRALLFGVIGGFVLCSLWLPAYRLPALLLAGVSMAGFIVISLVVGEHRDEISRIVKVDYAAMACLAIALWLHVVVLPGEVP